MCHAALLPNQLLSHRLPTELSFSGLLPTSSVMLSNCSCYTASVWLCAPWGTVSVDTGTESCLSKPLSMKTTSSLAVASYHTCMMSWPQVFLGPFWLCVCLSDAYLVQVCFASFSFFSHSFVGVHFSKRKTEEHSVDAYRRGLITTMCFYGHLLLFVEAVGIPTISLP